MSFKTSATHDFDSLRLIILSLLRKRKFFLINFSKQRLILKLIPKTEILSLVVKGRIMLEGNSTSHRSWQISNFCFGDYNVLNKIRFQFEKNLCVDTKLSKNYRVIET